MFKDLKILELAMYLPLPFTGAFFANAGAKVIKIEHPMGDPLKNLDNEIYTALNKKKQILHIDLKDNTRRGEVLSIIKEVDVVLNGFKPSFIKTYNLDYENAKLINPSIIYISLSAYEKNTPFENKAGHDLNFVSLSGIMRSLNMPPAPLPFQIADMAGALWAIIGTFYMLEKRRKTNNGGNLELSLFRSCLSLFPFFYFSKENGLIEKGMLYGNYACYNVYKCKDGRFIAVGSLEEKFFKKLLEMLNIEFDQTKFNTPEGQDYYRKVLADKFLLYDRDYWINYFKNEDICITPILEKKELLMLLKEWYENISLEDFLMFPFNLIKKDSV
jgi:alpha-methylacyl-CoA racemase